MRIRNKRDILKFAVLCTLVVSAIVVSVVFLAYPPEEWAWELKISLTLTVSVIMSICYYIGLQSLKTYKLTMELQRLVERDRLTDVATRDYFYSRMEQDPDGFGVSLMVDIDNFKVINDTHGHVAGDEVIRSVAAVLRENVREMDIVCRYGGEEFLLFLQKHEESEAFIVAERIREAVATRSVNYRGTPIRVTVSVGGSLRLRVTEIEESIRQADAALYRAKEAGRNRTVFVNLEPMADSA